jgi:tetratricopeptide (TPR) repeat protein
MLYRLLALSSILFVALVAASQDSLPTYSRSNAYGIQSGLSGSVRDFQGRPVGNARVEIVDLNSGRVVSTVFTYPNGSFEFPRLDAGRYEVIATAGVSESRNRLDLMGDRDLNIRLPSTLAASGQEKTISVAQMKVPGKARKIFDKALNAFRHARIDDAFNLVQKALGVCPDFAQALTLRGVLKMRKGDNEQAQPDLEKAVELDNSDDMGFVALASLYNNQKRYDEATRLLDRGIVLHPDSWQAHMEMARAEVGKKNPDAALKSLAKCDRNAPDSIYFRHLIRAQALILQKNYQPAVAELELFLKQEPEGPNSEPARKLLADLQSYLSQTTASSAQTIGTK